MRTTGRIFTALLLAGLLAAFAGGTTADAAKREAARRSGSRLRQELREISRSRSLLIGKLRETRTRERTATHRLRDSEARLHQNRKALDDVRYQLHTTTVALNHTRSELTAIKASLKKRNDALARRLLSNHRTGNPGYIGVLLGAEDFSDLLNRGYVVQQVVESDVDLIDGYKKDKAAVEKHEAVLNEQKQQRAKLEEEHARLTARAAEETRQRHGILVEISAERSECERRLAALERDSNRIASMIRSLERTPRGRARLGKAWTGSFMRPVAGRITSEFGNRFHPIVRKYRMHTGVDISAPSGTPIHAAAGGEIIYAGTLPAYGRTVIIDHGGGMTTLYGHQSRIGCRVGQDVKKGQVIGYVGSTGWSTGPHCHFEVRKHGAAVNPL